MPSSRDIATRLGHLAEILTHTTSGAAPAQPGDSDPVQVHLNNVPMERMQRLVAELRASSAGPDAVDSLVMRLLLNEYILAVGHLRAVARLAASRVDHAASPLRDARRAVHRFDKSGARTSENWLRKKTDIVD